MSVGYSIVEKKKKKTHSHIKKSSELKTRTTSDSISGFPTNPLISSINSRNRLNISVKSGGKTVRDFTLACYISV